MVAKDSSIDVSLAVTLDDLCRLIQQAADEGRSIESVPLAPRIYDMVAAARGREYLVQGHPLMLLGLNLVRDEDVAPLQAWLR